MKYAGRIIMKIIWFSHRCMQNPLAGGAERAIYEIGRRLVLRGHTVHHVAGGWKGAKRYEVVEGIQIHRYGTRVMPHLAHPAFLRANRDADTVVDDLSHAAPWFSPWFSDIPGVAFFYHLHAKTLGGQTSQFLASVLASLERHYTVIYRTWPFVTESVSSQRDLNSIGISEERIFRIPLGVDTDRFRPGTKAEKPAIVYFGGMRPYKRPEHALIAFKILNDRGHDAYLTMVGDGPSIPYLRSLATEFNLADRVSFTGRVSEQELSSIVSAAWVNIHTSMSEGWGLSIMEAASSGTPTIGYDVPGVNESVINGKTGKLVPDGDISSLSIALAEAIENGSTSSDACRRHAQEFSWEATATKWEERLKSTAGFE